MEDEELELDFKRISGDMVDAAISEARMFVDRTAIASLSLNFALIVVT